MRFFLVLAALAASCAHADVRPLLTVAVERGDTATALPSSYDGFVSDATRALDHGDPLHRWRMATPRERPSVLVGHVPDDAPEHIRIAGHRVAVAGFGGRGHAYVATARCAGPIVLVHVLMHEMLHAAYPALTHVADGVHAVLSLPSDDASNAVVADGGDPVGGYLVPATDLTSDDVAAIRRSAHVH